MRSQEGITEDVSCLCLALNQVVQIAPICVDKSLELSSANSSRNLVAGTIGPGTCIRSYIGIFNVGFVIDPAGEIVLKAYKIAPLYSSEHSVSPHDIYDWWIDRYGNSLDAFWPVADTEIGRIGVLIANDGSYPEHARALAMNGAEILYRGPLPHPMTTHDFAEIQNRARALDNNVYVLAPGLGPYYLHANSENSIDAGGGQSMVVDYRGRIIGKQPSGAAPSFVSAVIDIEALRFHRSQATVTNWMKDLRTEICQLIYSDPIYPKNLCQERPPMGHDEYRVEVHDRQVALMHERNIWVKPSRK